MRMLALFAAFLLLVGFGVGVAAEANRPAEVSEKVELKPYFVNRESVVEELQNRSQYFEQIKNEVLRAQGEIRVLERLLDREQDYLEAKEKEKEGKK